MKLGVAVGLDVIMVLVFAAVGRRTHEEIDPILGVLSTAWPFLVAAVIGAVLSRSWRDPYSWRTGIVVWLCTVLLGMGLRLLSGDTAAWPFWIVTFITLGVLLQGWRLIARAIVRTRTAKVAP